jgi:hypothetical protein
MGNTKNSFGTDVSQKKTGHWTNNALPRQQFQKKPNDYDYDYGGQHVS